MIRETVAADAEIRRRTSLGLSIELDPLIDQVVLIARVQRGLSLGLAVLELIVAVMEVPLGKWRDRDITM